MFDVNTTSALKAMSDQEFQTNYLDNWITMLTKDVLESRPDNVILYMRNWCLEKATTYMRNHLNQQTARIRLAFNSENDANCSDKNKSEKKNDVSESISSKSSDDDLPLNNESLKNRINNRKSRESKKMGISGESAYPAADFVPRVIPKSADEETQLKVILEKNFIFNSLDPKDKNIIINAMERKEYKVNDTVIKQGDDGHELFVVFQGLLECHKKDSKGKDVFLCNYVKNGLFGELALMYSLPRQATITVKESAVLFALDRSTFNNIVKTGVIRARQKNFLFLKKIDLLKDLEGEEIEKLCDVLKTERFNSDEFIVREGDIGDRFFLIQEGTAEALKKDDKGVLKKVFEYSPNDYFGELALLGGNVRKASIKVTSDVMIVSSIDSQSFKRLLGPIEEILKRNQERYQKYAAK